MLKISAGIGAAIFSLFLVTSLLSVGTAQAQTPMPTPVPTANPNEIEVPTMAEVTAGGGAAPIVRAKWELPDMQTDDGFQYAAGSGPTDLNNNGIDDADDDPIKTGMQMYPWLCDDPEQRAIEYCAIAEDETGLEDLIALFDKVWQPGLDSGQTLCPDGVSAPVDGYCFKYQPELVVLSCDKIGTWDESQPLSQV
ncbi:hypothetical protein IMZ48_24450, partial [Candidatus Bathyarchaeota archaeon]|nr:hypothetical protein [Candidatus Bathyarchaeota archaeon]